MTKEDLKITIIIVLFGLGLIAMGLFTDYTLSIAKIALPSWLIVGTGIFVIIGWFILNMLPEKYDKHGNPLKQEKK